MSGSLWLPLPGLRNGFWRTVWEVASGFIRVHHRYPLAQKDESSAIDPVRDWVSLCPNCHAVAHIGKEEPFAVEELREMLSSNKT